MLKDKKFWVGFLLAYLLLSFMPQLSFHALSARKKG